MSEKWIYPFIPDNIDDPHDLLLYFLSEDCKIKMREYLQSLSNTNPWEIYYKRINRFNND